MFRCITLHRHDKRNTVLTIKTQTHIDKALTYSVVERKDPASPEVQGKYYAQAQARGEAGIRELSQRIQQMCTVTRADVIAVLTALEDVVSDSLANGEIVRLGELCSLRVSLSGSGTVTKEEYHTGLIEKKRILFTGGTTLKNMLGTLKYQRVEAKPKKEEEVDPLP